MTTAKILGVVALCLAAPAGAKSKDTLADLEALAKQSGWVELAGHLTDVPPAKRTARWTALVEEAALGLLSQSQAENDNFATFDQVEALRRSFPSLATSKPFLAKRSEVGLKAFRACADVEACDDRFFGFVGQDRELAFQAGKIMTRAQNPAAASRFFKVAVAGGPAATVCADGDLGNAVLRGLAGVPGDPLIADAHAVAVVCFDALREVLVGALADGANTAANVCPLLKAKAVKLSELQTATCADVK